MRAGPAAVAGAGAVATALGALALGMPLGEGLQLLALAGGAALGVGAAGALLVARMGGRPMGAQVVVVALTATAAVAAGALAAARAMFLSTHDLRALVVVVGAASTVAAVAGLVLGRRVAEAGHALEEAARRLGEDPAASPAAGLPGPGVGAGAAGELAALGRRLEETAGRLAESRRREHALEASRRELVAWVSHDLRTPLAGIRAMAEALEDGVVADAATVARYHRTLRQEADRLAVLVGDLFELSRIQAGALRLQLERASLGDVVSDALAALAPLAAAKGVRLEGRLGDPPPELHLSTPDLARALRNLLENALRHTPADGAVTVDVGVDGGQAVVSVADGCGGIPVADLERVFEPAFRGQAARTPAPGAGAGDAGPGGGGGSGGGLGLAIVRGIVEAHRGDVSVRNEGPGCRFVVRLPLLGGS